MRNIEIVTTSQDKELLAILDLIPQVNSRYIQEEDAQLLDRLINLQENGGRFTVASYCDRPCAGIIGQHDLVRSAYYLTSIFVIPEYQGQGIGHSLLEHLKKEEKYFGVGSITTTTIERGNISSQQLFESAGFILEPHTKGYGARINL